ncbi:hypothetical protein PENTCL1PPCAC_25403, partial [Pristionchus entomophagus]
AALETGNEEEEIHNDTVSKEDPPPTDPASPTVRISVDSEQDVPSDIAIVDDSHVAGYALETDNDEDNEEVEDERRLVTRMSPSLIQMAHYEAVVDANMSNASDLTTHISTTMGERLLSGSRGRLCHRILVADSNSSARYVVWHPRSSGE